MVDPSDELKPPSSGLDARALLQMSLEGVWKVGGALILLYCTAFFLLPLTWLSVFPLAACATIIVFALLRKRLSWAGAATMLGVSLAVAALGPFIFRDRLYVVSCASPSLACTVTYPAQIASYRATIYPVSDPVKAALLRLLSHWNARVRVIDVSPNARGGYWIHAPLEHAVASLMPSPNDSLSVGYVEIPGHHSSVSINFRSNRQGGLGGEFAMAWGPTNQQFLLPVGLSPDGPGYWSASSLQAIDLRAWWEAVVNDLTIEAALSGDAARVLALCSDSKGGVSSRARLRQARMSELARPPLGEGDVFVFDAFMRARRLLRRHRNALDDLGPEDPLHQDVAYSLASGLFTANHQFSPYQDALYGYYRTLFAPEREWILNRFPDALAWARLQVGASHSTRRAFNELVTQMEAENVNADAAQQRLDDFFWQRRFQPDRQELIARMLGTGRAVGDALELKRQDDERGTLAWDVIAATAEYFADSAIISEHEPRRVEIARRLRRTATEAQVVVDELVARDTSALQRLVIYLRMRRLEELHSIAQRFHSEMNALANAGSIEAARSVMARMHLGRIGTVIPMLNAAGEASGALTASDITARAVENFLAVPIPQDEGEGEGYALLVLLIFGALAEESSLVDQRLRDRLWIAYGPGGLQSENWVGVAAARGVLVLAKDNRADVLGRRLLSEAGGDPPWLLFFLYQAHEENGFEYGAGTEAMMPWIRLVERSDR